MITFAILILIVAKALPGLNTHISSIHVTRITSIVFLFAGALSLNSLNLESIGSGIGLYSGLFQVTSISQLIEIFLFMIGGGILIAWPQINHSLSFLAKLTHSTKKGEAPKESFLVTNFGGKIYSSSSNAGSTSPFIFLLNTKKEGAGSSQSQLGATPCVAGEGYAGAGGLLTDKHSTDYSLVVLFSSLGSSLLISSYDLISIYLSIELQSFGLYVLSTLYRDSESSTSAGLKYFLLGGLSSCIILLGTGIIYSYTGTTNLESLYIINSVIDVNQQYIIQGINLGLSLIFIGFLFKIAAAPLHNWSPDVYDGTPTIVTTWLTIIPKIAILFILLELQIKLGSFGLLGSDGFHTSEIIGGAGGLKTIIVNNSGSFQSYLGLGGLIKNLLLISATLSLIIGSLLGLAQIRIKRLLAYSTISHIGFILLALAINTEQSIDSFIFYIIQYTITNLNIFLVILGLTYCLSTNSFLEANSFGASLRKQGDKDSSFEGAVPAGTGGWDPKVYSTAGGRGCFSQSQLGATPCIAGATQGGYKDISFIYEFKGLFFSNPLLSISLAVSLFSMAGIPPLIGFFSKQLVLYSALQNGYYFISVLAIIVSVISCSYYLQIIKLLFTYSVPPLPPKEAGVAGTEGPLMVAPKSSPILVSSLPASLSKKKRAISEEQDPKNEIILTNTHSYLISTLTFTILLFFIKPSLILNSTQLLSLSLFYI